ncbi:porphobilinogen deaminase [Spirochaetota bacterium]|nr:porphobilinogen deaminase [Spirochaetota bacterium]
MNIAFNEQTAVEMKELPLLKRPLVLACRKSALAKKQCEIVKSALESCYAPHPISIEIRTFQTQGDRNHTKGLGDFSTPGIFVKEIHQALLDHKADLGVHSLKDIPTTKQNGLMIRAVLKRTTPHDILITRTNPPALTALKNNFPSTKIISSTQINPPLTSTTKKSTRTTPVPHFTIGTASLRRQLFLKKLFPTWTFEAIRGNIDTRLKKLAHGMYDGLVLSEAGLERLGLIGQEPFIYTTLPFQGIIPAPAQGTIAIEARTHDRSMQRIAKAINDHQTALLVKIERQVMHYAGAGCQTPIGVYTKQQGRILRIYGMIGNIAAARIKRMTLFATLDDPKTINQATRKMGRHFKFFMKHH